MLLCFCYCFSHLICLHSVTWLLLISIFTLIFMYFLFLSDEKPLLKTLDYTVRIGSTSTFLYFDLLLIMHYYAFIMHLLCIYYAFIIVSYIYSLFSLFTVSVWRTTNARSVRVYYPNWQFTNIFIFCIFTQPAFGSRKKRLQKLRTLPHWNIPHYFSETRPPE